MAFPFPHISNKEKFEYTFLNEVALKVFPYKELSEVNMGSIQTFFKQLFNLDFRDVHRRSMLDSRLKVGNHNSGVMFEFSKDSIQISIAQDYYNDFKLSMLPILKNFVEAYTHWFDSCKGIQLKFVDVWPLAEENHIDDDLLMTLEEAIFSSRLRNMAEKIDENFKGFNAENDRLSVKMKFGYYISQNASQSSGVALESRCELIKPNLAVGEICGVASEMNDVLYDAFIWAVTTDITDAMKTPKIIYKE